MKSQIIETYLFNRRKYAILMSILLSVGTGFTAFLTVHFHNYVILFIGMILFWFCPLFFDKKIKAHYSKKALLIINETDIVIKVDTVESEAKEDIIQLLENIKAFKLYLPVGYDFFSLNIFSNTGKKVRYYFWDKERNKDVIESSIYDCIKSYNTTKSPLEKIRLAPGFYTTKGGTFAFILVTLLLIVSIAMQIYNHLLKTIPTSVFITIPLYLIIISQRKKDLQAVNNFNNA